MDTDELGRERFHPARIGSPGIDLETAIGTNHERHERHERGENKGPNRGWPTVDHLTRLMITPNSESPSPFVYFVHFVVLPPFSELKIVWPSPASPPSVFIRVHPWFPNLFSNFGFHGWPPAPPSPHFFPYIFSGVSSCGSVTRTASPFPSIDRKKHD